MKVVFALALLTPVSSLLHNSTYYEAKFYDWMQENDKSFEDGEEFVKRLAIFSEADDKIETHNANPGVATHTLGHNEFSHLTWDEFSVRMGLGGPVPERLGAELYAAPDNYTANADGVDWVEKGAVTAVKNQGSCGSCWSFSTTGAIEGVYYTKNGVLPAGAGLSEQNLVDCDTDKDMGCNGGLMNNAFNFVATNGGLCLEADYPYTGKQATCEKTCKVDSKSAIKAHMNVAQTDAALASALDAQPVAIAIEADQQTFQLYKTGVLSSGCGTRLDHGVLAVGYGTEGGVDYYKVKNSWGTTWGDAGYLKIERNSEQTGGMCGILLSASYPTY